MGLTLQRWLTFMLAGLFASAGVAHFTHTDWFMRVMPGYLPWHKELVHISGVCELQIAIGLVIRRLRRAAALGAMALLVAVFPAHIQAIQHPEEIPFVPVWVLWARLPVQGLLLYWASKVYHWGRTNQR